MRLGSVFARRKIQVERRSKPLIFEVANSAFQVLASGVVSGIVTLLEEAVNPITRCFKGRGGWSADSLYSVFTTYKDQQCAVTKSQGSTLLPYANFVAGAREVAPCRRLFASFKYEVYGPQIRELI